MSSNLVQRMENAVTDANKASNITYQVLTGALDTPVNVDGVNIPTLNTRVRDFLSDMLDGGDIVGDDGASIEAMSIDENGHLFVTITGMAPQDLGKIVPDDGIGVNTVSFNSNDGSVEFELDDGRVIKLNNIAGEDGVTIESARIQTGDLIFTMSNGEDINAGDISQFGGTSASDAEINEAGQLVVIFSDGRTETIGQVVGPRGNNGLSTIAGFIDPNGVLRFYRSDGSQYNVGQAIVPILDATGNAVEGARLGGVDNKELILELSSGDFTVGKIVGDDGIDGTDGISIEDIYIDENDNNLYVRLTGGVAQALGEVRTTIFENADVAVTSAIINSSGELILDISVNGAIQQENVGVVNGTDGRIITSADFNETTGILTFTDDSGDEITVGEIEQVIVTGASVDSVSGRLTIELSNGSSIDAGLVRGEDGVDGTGIVNAYMDASGDLFVEFDDPEIPDANVGNILAPVETGASFDENDHLIITLSDGQSFDLGKVKGVDGTTIESVRVENGVIYASLSDGSPEITMGNVQKNPISATVTPTGMLRIEFDDESSIETTTPVKALDGDTITDIRFDINNRDILIDLTTENSNSTSRLRVPAVRGRGIVDVAYNNVDRTLSFKTNDPTDTPHDISIEFPMPVDGDSITDIRVENGRLIFETNIEGHEPVSIEVPSSLSVADVRTNSSNNIEIELSDSTVYTLEAIEGVIGIGIDDARFDGNDLVFDISNGSTVRIPSVSGTDGDGITSIGIDNGDLVISHTLDGSPLRFPQLRGEDAPNTIIDVNYVDNDLVFELVGSPDVVVPMVRGEDGQGITDAQMSGNDLVLTTNIVGQETITIPAVKGIDGNSVESISFDGNDLVITTNIVGQETITIPAVKGIDGENGATIVSGVINNEDQLVLTMSDDDTNPTEYVIDGVGASVTGASLDESTGQLILTLSDDTTVTTSESIVGRDGNGTGIKSVSFTNGQLQFVLEDSSGTETNIDAGSVGMNSVVNVRIDESVQGDEGILVFIFEDNTEVSVGNVYGKDGRFVSNVELNAEDNLILTMSDDSVINAGYARGEDGRTVTSAEVLFSGDLLITYSDGDVDNAGSVGSGAGLTVWTTEGRPYVKDRVVIYDGGLYMSKIDENNDQPPSGNWIPLALGDQLIEIRAPRPLAPINNETSYSVRPTLVGSPYAAIVSIDERAVREFQITLGGDTEFNSVIYTYSSNSDEFEVTDELSINTSYLWRCRDTSERGYVSSWSDAGEFTVPEGIISQPTVNIHSDENINSTFEAPHFVTSTYLNEFDSSPHTSTDWVIRTAGTEDIAFISLSNATDLESIIIPVGNLEPSTNYEIRAKHRTGTIESPWSEWTIFTTENSFDYIEKPVVYYDGSLTQVSTVGATFTGSTFKKTATFAANSSSIPLEHMTSTWEVVNIDTGSTVETNEGSQILTEYIIGTTLLNNVNYRIRVKYNSQRFGDSAWSDWVDFNAEQSIDAPVVSTTETTNGFPSGGVFQSTEFNGINETHVSSDWEVRNFNTDVIEWESSVDTVNLTQIVFDAVLPDGDYYVRVRFNGNEVSSPWSNQLDFFYGTPE